MKWGVTDGAEGWTCQVGDDVCSLTHQTNKFSDKSITAEVLSAVLRSSGTHSVSQGGITEQFVQAVRQFGGIAGIHEKSSDFMLYDFWQSTYSGGNHRQPKKSRLNGRSWQGIRSSAGHDAEVHLPIDFAAIRHKAVPDKARTQFQGFSQSL